MRLSGRGNAWEPHLDQGVNHVLQFHGEKAWSLFHFGEAESLSLDTDPSSLTFRHSLRDSTRPAGWLKPEALWYWSFYPRWCTAKGTLVVLQPGDLLYIPPCHIHATEMLSNVSVTANRFAPCPQFKRYEEFAGTCRP